MKTKMSTGLKRAQGGFQMKYFFMISSSKLLVVLTFCFKSLRFDGVMASKALDGDSLKNRSRMVAF